MWTACRLLIVLTLSVAIPAGAWAQCAAEDLTPEQQACCASMGHNCGAAGVEMGCCPSETQTQETGHASGLIPQVKPAVVVRGPLSLLPAPHVRVPAVAAASFDRETLQLPERPPHLVLSVFLI